MRDIMSSCFFFFYLNNLSAAMVRCKLIRIKHGFGSPLQFNFIALCPSRAVWDLLPHQLCWMTTRLLSGSATAGGEPMEWPSRAALRAYAGHHRSTVPQGLKDTSHSSLCCPKPTYLALSFCLYYISVFPGTGGKL